VSGHLPKKARVDPKTKKAERVLSQASLLARSRKYGYWPFRLCFETGLRNDAKLGGKTRIRFRVTRSGHISSSRLVQTKLKDADVAACLVEAAQEIELLAPARTIDVEATIALWPGDAPLPTLLEEPEKKLSLDSDVITRALESARPSFASCYREALERDPALWGRIELGIELGADGAIAKVSERDSHFPDKAAVSCAISAAGALTLPALKSRPSFVIGLRLGAPKPSTEP